MTGSKVDSDFTYRRLDNLFEFNRKQECQQSGSIPHKPKVTVEYVPSHKLQKTVTNHTTRIETLETKANAMPENARYRSR